jgi:O-antigen/teichoic acid export membrane protein
MIPAIVSRHLSLDQFSAWSLALQVVAYVNLLGLGLQTATAREVAHAGEHQDYAGVRSIIRAAHSIGKIATICGLCAVLILAIAYPLIFPGIPVELLSSFRWALVLIGVSTATQLLALVPMGVFQGLHQNIYFVFIQVVVRMVTIGFIWIGANIGLQLLGLSAIIALCSLMLFPLVWARLKSHFPWSTEYKHLNVDTRLRRQLLSYCATLSVWSVSMLVVNSVGIIMVGRVDFNMSGAYSIAMVAATILAGLLGALFSPLMTTAAALYSAPGNRHLLPGILIKSTWICTICLHLLFIGIYIFHEQLIEVWVGVEFVKTVGVLLLILVGAHALRNIMSPYAMMLLATGLHRRALWTAIAEGVANFFATILLGLYFGIVGIALGTLIGVFVGVFGTLIFNTPNTPELTPNPNSFIIKGVFLPSLLMAPIYWFAIYSN